MRAGDRVEARVSPLALDERLGGRPDQREAVELEQEQVRGRVDASQRPVQVERRGRGRPLRTLREDDLERVTGSDVLLGRTHGRLEVGASRCAPGETAASVPCREAWGGAGKDACDLLRISTDHLRRAENVVEADQDVRDEETALRQAGAVGRQWDGRLEARCIVVGQVADDGLAARFGFREITEVRAAADERVAAETSAFDGLEQESGAALAAKPQVGAERCDEVGCDVGCDGHDESSGTGLDGTQKDLPAGRSRLSRTGCLWPSSVPAQAPAPLAAPGPEGASGRSHRRLRVRTPRRPVKASVTETRVNALCTWKYGICGGPGQHL